MNKVAFALVALVLAGGAFTLTGHGAEPQKVPELMQAKLTHAQKVLEGIALNDFDRVANSAEELINISKKAEWRVLKTPLYELYSNEFRNTANALVEHAKKKNLDASALAYVELTLSCVKCHKHVREVRMARLDP